MAGHHRPELPDGPVEVRHVQPYQAVKTYRCPGCDHEIPPGHGHEVVVPRDAPEDRRHWHTRAGTESRRAAPSSRRGLALRTRPRSRRSPALCRARASTDATSKRSVRARALGMLVEPAHREHAEPRCFVTVTASAGTPNAVLRRVFTSQNTSTRPRATTRSSSPSRQRQLRSRTR